MRYISLCVLLLLSFLGKSQPIPDCARTTTNKRLFIKSTRDLICDLRVGNARPSYLDSTVNCFRIDDSDIQTKRRRAFLGFKIYETITNFSKDTRNNKKSDYMQLYITGLDNDSAHNYSMVTFNFYIEIPKFIKGIYYIDASKYNNNSIAVNCSMCKGEVIALNITPDKYKRKRK